MRNFQEKKETQTKQPFIQKSNKRDPETLVTELAFFPRCLMLYQDDRPYLCQLSLPQQTGLSSALSYPGATSEHRARPPVPTTWTRTQGRLSACIQGSLGATPVRDSTDDARVLLGLRHSTLRSSLQSYFFRVSVAKPVKPWSMTSWQAYFTFIIMSQKYRIHDH